MYSGTYRSTAGVVLLSMFSTSCCMPKVLAGSPGKRMLVFSAWKPLARTSSPSAVTSSIVRTGGAPTTQSSPLCHLIRW